MDCFHQTNKPKKFYIVLQNQREATSGKTDESKVNEGVLHFTSVKSCWACHPLTSKQRSQETQPTTQILHRPDDDDAQSTEESAKYMDEHLKKKIRQK